MYLFVSPWPAWATAALPRTAHRIRHRLSVCLLLAVERVRTEARASFASTISGTDLIVGALGSVNLLLYSVFRIGNATNNIRWDSFEHSPSIVRSSGPSRSPWATRTVATG